MTRSRSPAAVRRCAVQARLGCIAWMTKAWRTSVLRGPTSDEPAAVFSPSASVRGREFCQPAVFGDWCRVSLSPCFWFSLSSQPRPGQPITWRSYPVPCSTPGSWAALHATTPFQPIRGSAAKSELVDIALQRRPRKNSQSIVQNLTIGPFNVIHSPQAQA